MRQAGGLQDMLADSLTSPTLMCIGAEAEKPAQQTAVKQIDRLAVYLRQRQPGSAASTEGFKHRLHVTNGNPDIKDDETCSADLVR